MGELAPRTSHLLRQQLPKVYKRVLARAIVFAKDARVQAAFGGHPGKVAEDLVQEALVRTLNGKRTWNPSRVDLEHFLVQTVRSIADSYKLRGSKQASDYDDTLGGSKVDSPATGSKLPETPADALARKECEERFENELIDAAGDDADLLQLVEALMSEVYLPRDIESELGWDDDKVNVVLRKLRRRMRRRRDMGGQS